MLVTSRGMLHLGKKCLGVAHGVTRGGRTYAARCHGATAWRLGAGLGAKHAAKRNFEAGFVTNMPAHIDPLMAFIDDLYLGKPCASCKRRDVCPDPIA